MQKTIIYESFSPFKKQLDDTFITVKPLRYFETQYCLSKAHFVLTDSGGGLQKEALLLHSTYTEQMLYFHNWIDAFKTHSNFSTLCINVFNTSKDLITDVKSKIEKIELIVFNERGYVKVFRSICKGSKKSARKISFFRWK